MTTDKLIKRAIEILESEKPLSIEEIRLAKREIKRLEKSIQFTNQKGAIKMLFKEAVEALMANKFVTREAWEASGEYLSSLPGMPYIWKIMTQPNPNAGNFLPLIVDLIAEDWKIVDSVSPAGQPAMPPQGEQANAAPTA